MPVKIGENVCFKILQWDEVISKEVFLLLMTILTVLSCLSENCRSDNHLFVEQLSVQYIDGFGLGWLSKIMAAILAFTMTLFVQKIRKVIMFWHIAQFFKTKYLSQWRYKGYLSITFEVCIPSLSIILLAVTSLFIWRQKCTVSKISKSLY